MKRRYFLAAAIFLTGAFFLTGCDKLSGTKAESTNAPQAATPETKTSPAVAEAGKQTRQILWDFKKPDNSAPPKISAAETRVVVKYLFGDEANANFELTSRVSGSFTKPNAKETLYFISGCDDQETKKFTTDCPHVSWDSAGRIAVYDGQTPVLKLDEALGGGIVKALDLDGDGISEILSEGGYAGMGIVTTTLRVGHILDGKYREIEKFDAYVSNCNETDEPDDRHFAKAAVIGYVPSTDGRKPEFSEEFFEVKCTEENSKSSSAWKKIAKKDFDAFFAANS